MATATQTSKILSAEQEAKLRQPIDEYVGKIQAQIDELRTDGTEKAVNIQNELDNLKRDRIYTAQEKTERETKLKAELAAAKAVEEKNKGQINKLIADAEAYLKAHYDSDYYQAVVASCKQEKVQAQQKYQATVEQLKKEHETALSKLSNQQEIKDEKDMRTAAKAIGDRYGCAVLLKGGHSVSDANDLLYADGEYRWFYGRRIDNPNTHGTGCTLSSAIAANLAKGYILEDAVGKAKDYISGTLAAMLDLGSGSGPMNHAFDLKSEFVK